MIICDQNPSAKHQPPNNLFQFPHKPLNSHSLHQNTNYHDHISYQYQQVSLWTNGK